MRTLVSCLSLAAAVAVASPSAQAPRKHFLWAVQHPGAPVTYLMGSLHVLTPEYYPLAPAIEKAFSESKVLIEEADLDELTSPATALALLGKAMFSDGRTLDQVIAPDLYKRVIAQAEKVGLPAMAVQRMKPWMVAVSLTGPSLKAEGFKAELGVDKHFFDRAKQAGMERRALETVSYQFDRLDQMAMPLQQAMLASVIADLDAQLSNVKALAEAWRQGDIAPIEQQLLPSLREVPELYERLLVERNRNWVAPVEECLRTRTACFVVVGAAHLVGPDSLVALLRQKGYTVEQR